jgi:Reverse transcriptase (RNA-dependent DNA polymerase)
MPNIGISRLCDQRARSLVARLKPPEVLRRLRCARHLNLIPILTVREPPSGSTHLVQGPASAASARRSRNQGKVCRALESIGFARSAAFKIAGESTIRQGDKYTLPRGFRQSSLLATLALEKSLFGSTLVGNRLESRITVHCDDIIFSSDDPEALADEHSHAIELLRRSNFPINPTKTQTARTEVNVFNIRMSHRTLRFTDERMWKFLEQAALFVKGEDAEDLYEEFFGDYIRSINPDQEKRIRMSLGLP